MKKILWFSSYFYPYISGLTIYPLRLVKRLSSAYKITVLTFPHRLNLPEKENLQSAEIVRVPFLFRVSKGYISPQSLVYFFRYLRGTDVVIVTLPNFEAVFLVILAKLLGKKIIALFLCEVDLGKNNILRIVNFFLNNSMALQLILSNLVIAFPDYIEQTSFWNLIKEKTTTLIPAVEKPTIDFTKLKRFQQQKGSSIWIGFVGRIAAEKGIEHLISAAQILLAKKLKLRLVFAGPSAKDVAGEEEYFLKIQKILREKKVPHQFLGMLSDTELGAFLKSIDLLVLPSTNKTEAFGMVQVEAMFVGTPVVASDLPGVKIPISQTGMGILVPPANAQKLAEAIQKILENRGRFVNETNMKKVEQSFDSQKIYRSFEKLVKTVTSG